MSQGQGAPVLQATSWTAAPSSGALGGGCTTPAARTTRPSPSSLVSSLPRFGAPGASQGARGEALALGLFRTPKGGSGRPRMPQSLPSGGPGTRREERARRAAETAERGGAKTLVAQGLGAGAGRGRGAPYLGDPRSPAAGGRASGGRTARLWGARSLGCTVPSRGAHPRAGAHSASRARTPSGALSPADPAGAWGAHPAVTPTAAAAGLVRRCPPKLRPAPPA